MEAGCSLRGDEAPKGLGPAILFSSTLLLVELGQLLCQWANTLGSTAIGIVSNEEKAALVHIDGCHHVIMYTKEVVATTVKEITDEKGVNVVYDSVGKDTYMKLRWLILEAKLVQFLTTPGLICFLLYPRLNWSK